MNRGRESFNIDVISSYGNTTAATPYIYFF